MPAGCRPQAGCRRAARRTPEVGCTPAADCRWELRTSAAPRRTAGHRPAAGTRAVPAAGAAGTAGAAHQGLSGALGRVGVFRRGVFRRRAVRPGAFVASVLVSHLRTTPVLEKAWSTVGRFTVAGRLTVGRQWLTRQLVIRLTEFQDGGLGLANGVPRQLQHQHRAARRRAARRHATPMAFRRLAHDGQSEARSRHRPRIGRAVEPIEHIRQVGVGDTRPFVGDREPTRQPGGRRRDRPVDSTSPRCRAGW